MTYTGPRLDNMLDTLGTTCMDILGDAITYQAPGGSYLPIRGYVEFGDQIQDLETGKIIAQNISVEVLKTSIAARPTGAARIVLPASPGITYRPINIRNGRDGDHWLFEVEKVNG